MSTPDVPADAAQREAAGPAAGERRCEENARLLDGTELRPMRGAGPLKGWDRRNKPCHRCCVAGYLHAKREAKQRADREQTSLILRL